MLYTFLILSIQEFYTKATVTFKETSKDDDLKDRAITAYKWYIYIFLGFVTCCNIISSLAAMSIVIHNKIRGNGTIGGVIKMIIITLIFAPFH